MNKKQSPKVLKYCLISFIVNITALAETIPRLVVWGSSDFPESKGTRFRLF